MPGYGDIWWTLIHLTSSSPVLDCLNQVAYVAYCLISSDNPTANVPTTVEDTERGRKVFEICTTGISSIDHNAEMSVQRT